MMNLSGTLLSAHHVHALLLVTFLGLPGPRLFPPFEEEDEDELNLLLPFRSALLAVDDSLSLDMPDRTSALGGGCAAPGASTGREVATTG